MDILTSLIIGALQGATEFLPISSSGHIVIAEKILGGRSSAGLAFEVLIHAGTMVSVIIYFRKKISRLLVSLFPPYHEEKLKSLRLVGIIVLATIPAAIVGLAFENSIEKAFASPKLTSIMLFVTAAVLISTHFTKKCNMPVIPWKAFLVGIAQSLALLPGISRSGMTISAGLFLRIDPAGAAEFSFLLSLPAVFGATLLKTPSLTSVDLPAQTLGVYLAGAVCAFFVGYLAIAWLMKIVRTGRFFYFGIYCLLAGTAGLLVT